MVSDEYNVDNSFSIDGFRDRPFSLDYRIAKDLPAMISYRELVQEHHQSTK